MSVWNFCLLALLNISLSVNTVNGSQNNLLSSLQYTVNPRFNGPRFNGLRI